VRRGGAPVGIIGAAALLLSSCDEAPMTFMRTFGPAADPITSLGWGMTVICSAVVVVIGALLLGAMWGRTSQYRSGDQLQLAQIPIGRTEAGLKWIYIGVAVSTGILLGMIIWTLITLNAVAGPSGPSAFTIEIRGHQWWWEARYIGSSADRTFTTANELHVPVGSPVHLDLLSNDVIHSFWIPALAGKTDVIPGQTNVAWLEAAKAGIYRGQCTEYCGEQHAQMAMYVIADPSADFQSWWNAQLAAASEPNSDALARGQAIVTERCGVCHTIRGTSAGGIVGPDLTHLMSRRTIAAGTLPNDRENLSHWISHAQAVKPGSRMPTLALAPAELAAVATYLQTLQ
jgi:cytochrome c oxidase subunit 2